MYNDTPPDMISHEHKCIFVEVPKTGSTSVRAILGKAWTPHLNLWQIKNQMETYWTRYGEEKTGFWRLFICCFRKSAGEKSDAANSRTTSNSDSFAIRGIASFLSMSALRHCNSEIK